MSYDLAIIGCGFAGLLVAKKAKEKNLNFCVIAEHAGATQHFSGAFDIIDPRWQETGLRPENYPSVESALTHFIKAHPQHLYAQLSGDTFEKNLVEEALAFFKFYQIPVVGDGQQMIAVFGSSGEIKPSGFALSSQALLPSEINKQEKVLYLNFSALKEYPASLIQSHLRQIFSHVEVLDCSIFALNRTSPLAHLLKLLDDENAQNQFIEFLKPHKAAFIFLPPVLGVHPFQAFHQKLQSVLKARVVELLSVLPSSSGMRVQKIVKDFFEKNSIPFFKAKVDGVVREDDVIQKITARDTAGNITEISAKKFILATGKYLGGGIECQRYFREVVFDLPLYAQGKKVGAGTTVTQLIQTNPLARQEFMSVGVGLQSSMKNLTICGHVLTGFDFSRDRCGFGVSIASALRAVMVTP
jgi:glycerol-3-phosphate dehydrogenase subunit B